METKLQIDIFFKTKATKVENGAEIKRLATDIVRMANADHPMLGDTFAKFVDAGENSPSYALLSLKHAEYDSYEQATKDYKEEFITQSEYLNKLSNTRKNLSKLEKSGTGLRLTHSLKTLWLKNNPFDETKSQNANYIEAYIKTAKNAKKYALKKLAILTVLTEGSRRLIPCKTGKKLKKITYIALKLINK